MKATIRDRAGDTSRLSLPKPFWIGPTRGPEHRTGVWVTGLFWGPKSGRCVVRSYSIWVRGQGIWGEQYEEVEATELAQEAELVGAELPDGFPAEVAA